MTAVLFDLDGTLVDGSDLPLAVRGVAALISTRVPGVDPARIVAANTAEWQELWPEVEDDWMLGTVPGEQLNDRAWRGTLLRCGIDDEALVSLASATFRELERRAVRPYPDVRPALAELRAAGCRLGVVTNGAAVLQRDKLGALGLDGELDPVVVSSEIGARKPDRAVFDHAVLSAGLEPASTWFVGDNLWVDVLGASGAGLRTVWVNRNGRPRPDGAPLPDAEVASLLELPALLAQEPR
ncbi:MAG TPA: HAD family hydrolase [Amnibacterium sp.]|nr:HAD family hydrolase [Amnibacterium sp.]